MQIERGKIPSIPNKRSYVGYEKMKDQVPDIASALQRGVVRNKRATGSLY